MKNVSWKDVLVRAAKTFAQAVIGALVVSLPDLSETIGEGGEIKTVLLSLAVGAIAAGVSAAWNGVLAPLFRHSKDDEDGNS